MHYKLKTYTFKFIKDNKQPIKDKIISNESIKILHDQFEKSKKLL
jgi:hypothetical protein